MIKENLIKPKHLGCQLAEIIPIEPDLDSTSEGKCGMLHIVMFSNDLFARYIKILFLFLMMYLCRNSKI